MGECSPKRPGFFSVFWPIFLPLVQKYPITERHGVVPQRVTRSNPLPCYEQWAAQGGGTTGQLVTALLEGLVHGQDYPELGLVVNHLIIRLAHLIQRISFYHRHGVALSRKLEGVFGVNRCTAGPTAHQLAGSD